jgi:hypothetical protein
VCWRQHVECSRAASLEVGHILSLDIVGYSKLLSATNKKSWCRNSIRSFVKRSNSARPPGDSRGCFPRLEDVAPAQPHQCAINRCLFIQDGISGAFALYVITAKMTCTVQVLLNLKIRARDLSSIWPCVDWKPPLKQKRWFLFTRSSSREKAEIGETTFRRIVVRCKHSLPSTMINRIAACSCGQLNATVTEAPIHVSICHCTDCQRRTGSVFAT